LSIDDWSGLSIVDCRLMIEKQKILHSTIINHQSSIQVQSTIINHQSSEVNVIGY